MRKKAQKLLDDDIPALAWKENMDPYDLSDWWPEDKSISVPHLTAKLHNDPDLAKSAFRSTKGKELKELFVKGDKKKDYSLSQFTHLVKEAVSGDIDPEDPAVEFALSTYEKVEKVKKNLVSITEEGGLTFETETELGKKDLPRWYYYALLFLIDVMTGHRRLWRCEAPDCDNVYHPERSTRKYCSETCASRVASRQYRKRKAKGDK